MNNEILFVNPTDDDDACIVMDAIEEINTSQELIDIEENILPQKIISKPV
jgi:hypothetical protein